MEVCIGPEKLMESTAWGTSLKWRAGSVDGSKNRPLQEINGVYKIGAASNEQ